MANCCPPMVAILVVATITLWTSVGEPVQSKEPLVQLNSTNVHVANGASGATSSTEPAKSLLDWAQEHPLCSTKATAYVGQTAKMFCCLARLDRDLSVSWIRKGDNVVVLTHGKLVFTSDERVTAHEDNGIWSLEIRKVGHEDAGIYECQTNSEVKESVTVDLQIMETRAEIKGPLSKYVKAGSSVKLDCRVFLGDTGPDEDYKRSAVIHWFHEQRLLDPAVEKWRSRSAGPNRHQPSRMVTRTEVTEVGINGWIQIHRVTPYDSGNYTCVPSYAIPAWTQVHIMHDETQASLYDGVSEVKVDTSSASSNNAKLPDIYVTVTVTLLNFLLFSTVPYNVNNN